MAHDNWDVLTEIYLQIIPRRHNKRKTTTKIKSGSEPKSDDSISTVLEEDEEDLERAESLLEHFLESKESSSNRTEQSENGLVGGNSRGIVRVPPRAHRNSILESLNASNAPVELRQATALLLQSSLLDERTARLLTSDIMNQPVEGVGVPDGTGDEGEGHENIDTLGLQESEQSSENDGRGEETPDTNTLGLSHSSSLLPATSADEILRPSIFTMNPIPPDE